MPLPRVLIVLLLSLACMSSPVRAGDDMQAVSAVWTDFVAALRRGDYRSAHALFSPESRQALSFVEFAREYGPLSAARELVVARPENLATRLEEDWAEIAYSGINAATGRAFRVEVALVRNQGAWNLVAARNERVERIEAEARGILRTAVLWRGQPDARKKLQDLLGLNAGRNPALECYRFETDGSSFLAVPLAKDFRAFHVDAWGTVRPGLNSAPRAVEQVSRSTSAAVSQRPLDRTAIPKPPPPAPGNGLPELSEPPPMDDPFAGPGELSEPPPPDFGAHDGKPGNAAIVAEPEPIELPEFIQ